MPKAIFIVVAAMLLAGCATHSEPKPAVCDGKHRRPANPYGSVLPNIQGAGATPPPASAAPGPQSSIDPQSIAPCGARA